MTHFVTRKYDVFLLNPCCRVIPLNCLCVSDIGREVSVTLPASSSSYQVTGLRLGRRYRFTVQPTFASGLGTQSSVDERTGNTPTRTLSCIYTIPLNTF